LKHEFKVTTNGNAAIIACMALSKPPTLTRVAFGSGLAAEGTDLADVHALLEPVADGAILDWRHTGNRLCFTVQYANVSHPEVGDFPLSEYMVYIIDPATGEETDYLYGTLGDYRQPMPQYLSGSGACVFSYPLEVILSGALEVRVDAPAGLLTWLDLGRPGGAASLDETGKVPEEQLPPLLTAARRHVIAARPRDPSKPGYGAEGGGEDGGEVSVALETGPYTGITEAGVVVSGVLYDAGNVSTHGDTAPDGTIIIKTEEKENG